MRNRRLVGKARNSLQYYDRIFPIVVVISFVFFLNKVQFGPSLDFKTPFLTIIITLVFLTVLFDTLIMHFLVNPDNSFTNGIGSILRANLLKIFGGGLTQVLILSAAQGNVFRSFLKKWELLVVVNILASIPFFLSLLFSSISQYHLRSIVVLWAFLITISLTRYLVAFQTQMKSQLVFRCAVAALFSQFFASIALLLCTNRNNLNFIPLISFVFIISLTIPIPNGLIIREFILIYIFKDSFTLDQILFGSLLFRIIQLGVETLLGIFSYCALLYTKKKSLSDIDK